MASLTPSVVPAVNSVGNPISIFPKVTFEQAIEQGVANSSHFFIAKISKTMNENIEEYLQDVNVVTDIVPAKVVHRRINLLDNDDYTGSDHGDTVDAGELFRSEVTIQPEKPLAPNSNFAVILSKFISTITVFDPLPNPGNSGSGNVLAQGPYSGLVPDTYTISIIAGGGKYSSQYVWTRSSDSQSSLALQSSGRWIEIDKGIQLKFLDGTYDIGDSFTIEVVPKDEQTELFSWTFSTGLGAYQVPEDERSNDVVELPVINPNVEVPPAVDEFIVEEIFPAFATTNLRIAAKGRIIVGGVAFKTSLETDDFNGWKISFVSGGIAGSEVVTQVSSNEIEITIEDNVSTAQQVADAFNASALNVSFEATTGCPDAKQKAGISGRISRGVDENKVVLTFSDDVEASTIADRIKITSQPIFPAGQEEDLYFETTVVGNQVIINFPE